MGKKSPKAPPAPDPVATAAAQGAANRDTAMTQQVMNLIDQEGPDGSLTHNKMAEETFTDSLTGKQYTVPRYKAVQTLSESGQRRKDQTDALDFKLNDVAAQQTDRIGGLLSQPVNLNNESTEARLMELGSKRLNPRFAEEDEALRTRLANQGIRAGSAAYDAEMRRFGENKNDAFTQLLLAGRGQSVQETLAERNQPINEISALLNGGQVSQPNFINTPTTNLAAPDYQGAVNAKYAGDLAAYDAQMKQKTGMFQGFGQMFGTLGAAAIRQSDRRTKTDIKKVGKLDNGLPVYTYKYKGTVTPQMGVMAQDVEKKNPRAVVKKNGVRFVDLIMATATGKK
jgi:hypothetical protein